MRLVYRGCNGKTRYDVKVLRNAKNLPMPKDIGAKNEK
jgi:hypothetical protein